MYEKCSSELERPYPSPKGKESANILARLSSMSLFITLRIEPDGRIAQKSPLLRQLGSLMLAHAIEQSRQGENDDNAR